MAALYPAQGRMRLLIKATGQLSGRVERLSALVKAKHRVWRETVNPAWLFLYYVCGEFLNTSAALAHLGLAGWLDQLAVGNGPYIVGAGLTNSRLD